MAVKVTTKLDKGAEPVETLVTINWDDSAVERVLAMQAAVVRLQGRWRAAGSIPREVSISISELRAGQRAAPESLEQKVSKLSDADKAELIRKLQASMQS